MNLRTFSDISLHVDSRALEKNRVDVNERKRNKKKVDLCASSTFEHAEDAICSNGSNGSNGAWDMLGSISNCGSCATFKNE